VRQRRWIGIAAGLALAGQAACYTGRATPLASDERLKRTGLAPGDAVAARLISYQRCRVPDPVSQGDCETPADMRPLEAQLQRCLAEQLGAAHLGSSAAPRYLLEVRVRTAEGGFPTGGASGMGWMIGRRAQRTTGIAVEILDAQRAAFGRVEAKAYGASGWGVLFLLNVFPIPMIEDARTESAACTAMAGAVAKFLEDPEPRRWVPEG
jgi:hypothetical protein